MDTTDRLVTRFTIAGAVVAPCLHTLTDVVEWVQGGFSPWQLWVNYFAFLPLPAVVLGLYAAQRPAISTWGLSGALGYGFAFIYFAHTTLLALSSATADYQQLWETLGPTYTAHGALMIVSGACFGLATLKAKVFPAWTAWTFLGGIAANLVLGMLPTPDILQTGGTLLRNCGLVGMGWALATTHARAADRA